MTNEELEQQILELCNERWCKPCQGRGEDEYFYWNKKTHKEEMKMRECNNCSGTGKVPSYFAQELADKLRGI